MAAIAVVMDFDLEIILFALVLSIDSFSAAIALGVRHFSPKRALFFALSSGLTGSIITAIGFLFGQFTQDRVTSYDHWIAFIVLTLVGGHMCYNAYREMRSKKIETDEIKIHSLWKILFVSTITSVDTLGVGISLGLVNEPILPYIIAIFCGGFFATYLGLFLAKKISGHLGEKVEFFGGGVLIALGIKMLSI